jgi:hypothetical protein
MRVIHESPPTAGLGGVGVAFAVWAQGRAAYELTGVVAFVGGLLAAHAAFALAVLVADVAFTCGLAVSAPSKVVGALGHGAPLGAGWAGAVIKAST